MPLRLDDRALRRARAFSQRLLPEHALNTVDDVARAQYAIQAQDQTAAALTVRSRSSGLTVADIAAAIDSHSLILTWSLRGTLHFHRAEELRSLLGLLGPVFARGSPGRNRALGIHGDSGDHAVRQVREALAAHGPLTRIALSEQLARHGIDPGGQATVHVLHRAALEGTVCIVPRPRQRAVYTLLDDWVPRTQPLAPEAATAQVARRFVDGYGPVVPADLALWTGLGLGFARRAWTLIERDLETVATPRGEMWVLRDSVRLLRSAIAAPTPLRLLGAFENWLLAYADRTYTLDAEDVQLVNAGGGLLKPFVLADGRVTATLRIRRLGGALRIDVTPLKRLSRTSITALEREAADAGRFFGGPVDITYSTGQ
jgi:hypothetical protein